MISLQSGWEIEVESVAEIIAGVAVELGIVVIAGGVIYRFFAGRFLIPKREIILPNQRGVLVRGEEHIRVLEPGACWIRPKQKLLLCDVRPRTLQIEGFDVLSSDGAILRLSATGDYVVSDPLLFFKASGNARDAMYFELRKALTTCSREMAATVIHQTEGAKVLAERTAASASGASKRLGLEMTSLEIWEVYERGWNRSAPDTFQAGLVH